MDTWQGDFGWQTHARSGRPDLLNYLRTGDFTWEDLWAFYNDRGLPSDEARARCMRLFHQYLSWQLDVEGGMTELAPEVVQSLHSWARFCVEHRERLPEETLREELVRLAEGGAISPTYFRCAYEAHLEAMLAHYCASWDEVRAHPVAELEDIHPCVGEGRLAVYLPKEDDGLPIVADPQWQRFRRAVAQQQHDAWCGSYAALMERMHDMVDERPSL